jgi:hypothetical protein
LSTSTLPGFLPSIHLNLSLSRASCNHQSNQPPIISCTVWYCNPSSGSSIMSGRSCDNFKDKTPQDYALLCSARGLLIQIRLHNTMQMTDWFFPAR